MKMILEARDVKAVKDALSDYSGIIATDEFVRSLILSSKGLGGMLFECDSHVDTQCREYIHRLLIDVVKKHMQPPGGREPGVYPPQPRSWEWPTYGDTKEYTAAFYAAFKKAGLEAGLKFSESWDKDHAN